MATEQGSSSVPASTEPPALPTPTAPTATDTSDKPSDTVVEATETSENPAETTPAPATTQTESIDETQHTVGDESSLVEAPETATASADVDEPEDGASAGKSKRNSTSKRKSTGVPEHNTPKGKKGKKGVVVLNLDAKPGSYQWAKLKGYPPWPAMVCDEEMLPETLLSTRPVTAMRADGTVRPDFMPGGKNQKDRTFPVMYLGTNEFSWLPNIDLTPIDHEELQNSEKGAKGKVLWNAYLVAKEGHDIDYFKNLLMEHEKLLVEEERLAQEEADKKQKLKEEKAAKAAEKKKESAKKAKAKKSADVEESDEVAEGEGEGEDGSASAKKSSKKRKTESEGESGKPAKAPKTKLKLSTPKEKTPSSKSKPKKAAKPEVPVLSEAELRDKREKEVLYLRHRLQKGFLTRDEVPKPEEMAQMGEYFDNLNRYRDLEVSIIRGTKIHKVLKQILKLPSIPRDEEFDFRKRSIELLDIWQKALAEETTHSPITPGPATNGTETEKDTPKADAAETNGDKEVAPKPEEAVKAALAETSPAPPAETSVVDTSMTDAPPLDAPASEVAKAVPVIGGAPVVETYKGDMTNHADVAKPDEITEPALTTPAAPPAPTVEAVADADL